MKKLNLGCGGRILNNWINIDLNTVAERNERLLKSAPTEDIDLQINLLEGLPYKSDTIDFIYNEHLLEHFSFDEGKILLDDWYRVLKENGVLRIAMPSIMGIVEAYKSGLGKKMFQQQNMGAKVRTNSEFFNVAIRNFGHKFIYDYDTIALQLKRAGFKNIKRQKVGFSTHKELSNMEHRIKGKNSALQSLCIEATK